MSEPAAASLDPRSFADFITTEPGPVVVDFWAPWCGPCLALAPHLERLAERFAGQLQVRKLNVDDAPELAATFGVRSVPTLVLFEDGQPQARLVGLQSEAQLTAWVRSAL